MNSNLFSKKLVLLLILLTSFPTPFIGQSENPNDEPLKLPLVVPPSPEAASLGKYGDFPVSYFTGTPNISIPLYEIDINGFKMPISLSYHASGFRVSEVASRIGLGWTLNAGGAITRSIKGIADEENSGWASGVDYPQSLFDPNAVDHQSLDNDFSFLMSGKDTEPDDYSFNFVGQSGKLILGPDFKAHCVPFKNLKLIFTTGHWEARDPGGANFFFGGGNSIETVTPVSETRDIATGDLVWVPSGFKGTDYTSAWFLNKIVTPQGDNISLNYHNEAGDGKFEGFNEMWFLPQDESTNDFDTKEAHQITRIKNKYTLAVLDSICFPHGKVVFEQGEFRLDYPEGGNVPKTLKAIKVYDKLGSLIKTISFSYSYFESEGASNPASGLDYLYLRLKLDKIIIHGGEGSVPQTYKFQYNSTVLPPYGSTAQDYWGFFNDAEVPFSTETGKYTLVPEKSYYARHGYKNGPFNRVSGTNREVNPDAAQACLLQKITFPTGGSTKFIFGGNEFFNANDLNEPIPINPTIDVLFNFELKQKPVDPEPIMEVFEKSFTYSSLEDNEMTVTITLPPKGQLTPMGSLLYEYRIIDQTTGNSDFFHKTLNLASFPDNDDGYTPLVLSEQIDFPKNHQFLCQIVAYGGDGDYILNISGVKTVENTVDYNDGKFVPAGGIRIQEIQYYDAKDTLIGGKEFSYKVNDHSSGTLNHDPIFFEYSSQPILVQDKRIQNAGAIFYSSSQNGMGEVHGGTVGYSLVTEKEYGYDNSENQRKYFGRRELFYTTGCTIFESEEQGGGAIFCFKPGASDLSTFWGANKLYNPFRASRSGDNWFPYVPVVKKSWQLGNLVHEKIFNENNHIVKHVSWDYDDDPQDRNYFEFLALKKGFTLRGGWVPSNLTEEYDKWLGNTVVYSFYKVISGWQYLKKKTTSQWAPNGQYGITTTEEYSYDNPEHGNVTSVKFSDSKGNIQKVNYFFPGDPLSDYSSTQIDKMRADGFFPKLKTRVFKDGSLLSEQKNYYQSLLNTPSNNDFYQLESMYKFNPDGEVVDFVEVDRFNSQGQIAQYHGKDALIQTILYAYNGMYPVATIQGVTYDQIIQKWGASFILDLSSCFDNFQIRQKLSSLRQNFPNSLIQCDIFLPLKGVKEHIDNRNITTFYEYDDFGRLMHIKDHLGNIVKKFEYNYADQTHLSVSSTSHLFSTGGGNAFFDVESDIAWSLEKKNPSDTWFSFSKETNGFSVSVLEQTSVYPRTGIILVKAGSKVKEITIDQEGWASTLSASPASYHFSSSGGSYTFNVTCNSSWIVEKKYSYHSWFSITKYANSFSVTVYKETTSSDCWRIDNIQYLEGPDYLQILNQFGNEQTLNCGSQNITIKVKPGMSEMDLG